MPSNHSSANRPTDSRANRSTARPLSRRDLLKLSAAAGAGFWVGGRAAWADDAPRTAPSEKLNVGFIGVANRAGQDLKDTSATGLVNVVALCDVDDAYLAKAHDKFPKAEQYSDYRKLLEQKNIDAVVIGTPDHTHAVATAAALRLGKHVYCEKPLTHTVHEARFVTELAAKQKLVTQMGTQIHAGGNYRRTVELVKAGVIGPIREVHVWCNTNWSADAPPKPGPPAPAGLHYDLWVGPAPYHPYSPAYVPERWRRYWAYGDGSLGDMACHYCDLPFWALDLRHPTTVQAQGPEVDAECCPGWMVVNWTFPARGDLPPVKLTWYEGGRKPHQFDDSSLGMDPGWKSGVLFVGEKGHLFADYGQWHLLPAKDFAGFKPPEPTIPDSIGHHKEWVVACLKNDPASPLCRFDYSGALTEAVLLGNVAYRTGKPLDWDSASLKATNAPEAEEYLHYKYRDGWEL